MTLVERESRRVVAHAVCEERMSELMQSVVDAAQRAARYYSDGFNTYREPCRWGAHTSMYNESETYSVEGDNAELRHYLARRSHCLSKCINALRRAVEPFVWCWNLRQMQVTVLAPPEQRHRLRLVSDLFSLWTCYHCNYILNVF